MAEIGWLVWSTPANFNRFHILTSLLHGHRSMEVTKLFAQCLAVSWAGTQHFRGLFSPIRILPGAKFTLRPHLALSYIGSVTARDSSSGRQLNCAPLHDMELAGIFTSCDRSAIPFNIGWSNCLVCTVLHCCLITGRIATG